MPTIGFATYSTHPDILPDDMLFASALVRQGFEVQAAVWDDPAVSWRSFDRVIVRSTWDYYKKPAAFFLWLDKLHDLDVAVWNSVPTMRWNANKIYLHELEQQGIPVVPTYWVMRHNHMTLNTVLQNTGWESYIIKPTISAGAYHTITGHTSRAADDEQQLQEILQFCDVMIQPLIASVQSHGEYSCIFFRSLEGIELSHTVLKIPKVGDFRVQEELGGRTVFIEPEPALRFQSRRIIEQLCAVKGFDWLYARVDAVLYQGSLHVMELEMVEPSLFFTYYPPAAERLASIVKQRCGY